MSHGNTKVIEVSRAFTRFDTKESKLHHKEENRPHIVSAAGPREQRGAGGHAAQMSSSPASLLKVAMSSFSGKRMLTARSSPLLQCSRRLFFRRSTRW